MSIHLPEPFVDAQAEVGMRERGTRRIRDLVQGHAVRPLSDMESHARRADVLEVVTQLGVIAQLLDELVRVDSGEFIAVPMKLILNAADPFKTFKVEAPDQFHALQIDNPSAQTVDTLFSGGQPTALNSDNRTPKQSGELIARPYDIVSIGFDPAVVPAGNTQVYVTFYSRPFPPTMYTFAP